MVYYSGMDNTDQNDYSELETRVARAYERTTGAPLGDVRLALLVKNNASLLVHLMDKTLEPHGIGSAEYIVLMALRSKADNLANPSDLCLGIGETRSNMTRITDELVAKNLIRRVTNPNDRRRVDLSLTDAGIELLRKAVPELRRRTESVLSVFSSEAKLAFEADLLKLRRALQAHL
jgi:MarR family transcriptional repressor of emrRAB